MRSANIGLTGLDEFALCMRVVLLFVMAVWTWILVYLLVWYSLKCWMGTNEIAEYILVSLSLTLAALFSLNSFDCLMATSEQKVDNKVWEQAYFCHFSYISMSVWLYARANDVPLYTRVALSRYKFYKVLYVLLTSSSCWMLKKIRFLFFIPSEDDEEEWGESNEAQMEFNWIKQSRKWMTSESESRISNMNTHSHCLSLSLSLALSLSEHSDVSSIFNFYFIQFFFHFHHISANNLNLICFQKLQKRLETLIYFVWMK